MIGDICKNCGSDREEHYDEVQCPIGHGEYSSTRVFEPEVKDDEVTA